LNQRPVEKSIAELCPAYFSRVGLPQETTRKLTRALLQARLDSLETARKRGGGDLTAELPVEPQEDPEAMV
jgi:hypothetical protein